MTNRIQNRRDTAANWAANNPALSAGEMGYETDSGRFKIGNGTETWNLLPYYSSSSSSAISFNNKTGTGIIIPMYVYPTDVYTNVEYNLLIDSVKAASVPVIAIINPSNGPGTVVDGNYTAAIKRMKSAGITVAGYISTSYTARNIVLVKADIDKWKELYPDCDGIFFDEMTYADLLSYYTYYASINNYCKGKGFILTITNPGSPFAGGYYDNNCADIIIGWEDADYPTLIQAKEDWDGGAADYSKYKRGALVHTQVSWDAGEAAQLAKYYGWIYITEDEMPNPWDELSDYLDEMITLLS